MLKTTDWSSNWTILTNISSVFFSTLITLSEQQILDCSDQYGNVGCNGGTMNNSFTYIQMNGGIETSDSYPYEGQV